MYKEEERIDQSNSRNTLYIDIDIDIDKDIDGQIDRQID